MRVPLKPLFILLFIGLSYPLLAQSSRVGYVDFDAIYAQLPDTKQMQKQLDTDKTALEKNMAAKRKLLEQKAANAQTSIEVTQLSEQLRSEISSGMVALEDKKARLIKEIKEKIKIAIRQVAQEKGYASIQPLSQSLYCSPEDNLTAAVLNKMGL